MEWIAFITVPTRVHTISHKRRTSKCRLNGSSIKYVRSQGGRGGFGGEYALPIWGEGGYWQWVRTHIPPGFIFEHQFGTRLGPRVPEPWVFNKILEFLNKFLEFFHEKCLEFWTFKEKYWFLIKLVTKNDEKWGTPRFFFGFLSLFRLKMWKKVPVPYICLQGKCKALGCSKSLPP